MQPIINYVAVIRDLRTHVNEMKNRWKNNLVGIEGKIISFTQQRSNVFEKRKLANQETWPKKQ